MKHLLFTLILGITQIIFSQKSNNLSERDKQYLLDNYRAKTFAELASDIGVQTYYVREFCNSGPYQNVFWDGTDTLRCLHSNEPIEANSKGEYHFFYSSNEDRRVYEKTLSRPERFLFYKFKTKEYAQHWCDRIPFESKQKFATSRTTNTPVGDTKLKTVHFNAEISNFKRNNLGVTFYKGLPFTGYKKVTYPNGAILEISKYKGGLTDDLQTRYYQDGFVKSKIVCFEGEVYAGKEFYENGEVSAVIELEVSPRKTKKTYYDYDGNVINRESFDKIVYQDYFKEEASFNSIELVNKDELNKEKTTSKEIPPITNSTLSIDHYTIDGYELTKYINVSNIPALKNKLTEFTSVFSKLDFDNIESRYIFQEHNTPGYVVITTVRESINGLVEIPHFYFNQRAIKIIYNYLSKYGYSYFDQEIITDIEWNDDEVKESCAKTFQRYDRQKCPNCNGESRFINYSDKYSTDSQSNMQNCTSCDRTFRFQVWNWNGRGWKSTYEKKPGSVKCSGCKGYGYSEDYHGGGKDDVTTTKCHVSGCNNGWVECRKCYGKGQKRSSVLVNEKHVTTQKKGCTRCNNSGEINTGKIKTYTCSSCNGKGYTLKRIRNLEWTGIEEYYKNNNVIQPELGFHPGGESWKVLKSMEEGTYFICKSGLDLKYHRLGTDSLTDTNKTVSKYDFVQIAFQRKIKK